MKEPKTSWPHVHSRPQAGSAIGTSTSNHWQPGALKCSPRPCFSLTNWSSFYVVAPALFLTICTCFIFSQCLRLLTLHQTTSRVQFCPGGKDAFPASGKACRIVDEAAESAGTTSGASNRAAMKRWEVTAPGRTTVIDHSVENWKNLRREDGTAGAASAEGRPATRGRANLHVSRSHAANPRDPPLRGTPDDETLSLIKARENNEKSAASPGGGTGDQPLNWWNPTIPP